MQTLLNILKIENAAYMALVIEATGESGPSGLPAISVAHYGEQNGDGITAPEGLRQPTCGSTHGIHPTPAK